LCEACGARSSIKANYAWQKVCYTYLLTTLRFFALGILSTMCFTRSPTNEESFYIVSLSSLAALSSMQYIHKK
jgi:hypothetical protein